MKRLMLLFAVLVMLSLTGCRNQDGATSSNAGSDTPHLALLMKARTNPFFDHMASGAEAKAKQLGVKLDVLAIDEETDAERQAGQVEIVTAKGVDAILIAPADSKAIIAPLLQAQAQGIKIINLDNRIDPQYAEEQGLEVLTFVGPDNEEGARKSTEALIEAIGGQGEVAMLEGIRGVDNAEARKRGFLEAVEAAGNDIEVVAMDSAEWATEPAQRKMEGILNAHPDLDGVFCANDMMAIGAIRAIDSAGKGDQIVVTAYDNLKAAREAIRNGKLHATVEQYPDKMGALGVQYAVDALRGDVVPSDIPVPTDLITREDVEATPEE